MPDPLLRDDWARIAEALSHFTHNPDFLHTYGKVCALLEDSLDGSAQ